MATFSPPAALHDEFLEVYNSFDTCGRVSTTSALTRSDGFWGHTRGEHREEFSRESDAGNL
jgi:hypothetical protein